MSLRMSLAVAAVLSMLVSVASADDASAVISIENHRFVPAELVVPADKRIKLTVKNLDSSPEEFESHDLNREKVIPGGADATIYIGPLEAGTYKFFGEFHEDTAQGLIVAK